MRPHLRAFLHLGYFPLSVLFHELNSVGRNIYTHIFLSMDQQLFLRMDEDSFQRLSAYVTREYGIKLPPVKRSMLESRLNKKVKSLGMDNYKEFLNHIFSEEGKHQDLFQVIDLITTNKTDFFRESGHFNFLVNDFLPKRIQQEGTPNLTIWSAGCSSGEEPYTLVMVLEEYKRKYPQLTYSILASDVSTRMIQAAFQGIYSIEKINSISKELKHRYFQRSKTDDQVVRVRPEFRKRITYRRINFMDDDYGLRKHSNDIIFCRNVLIYFDKATQEKVISNFCRHLSPGGLLFLGHSESIMGMNLPLNQIQPTVYQLIS